MFERSIALAIEEVRRYYPILYLGGPQLYLVYAGDQTIQLSDGHLITWQQALHVL